MGESTVITQLVTGMQPEVQTFDILSTGKQYSTGMINNIFQILRLVGHKGWP